MADLINFFSVSFFPEFGDTLTKKQFLEKSVNTTEKAGKSSIRYFSVVLSYSAL